MESNEITEVKSRLKQLIAYELDTSIEIESITDEMSLYEDGVGLDSISIVNLIVLIEEKFEITLSETDLTTASFKNINSLSEFVSLKISSKNQ